MNIKRTVRVDSSGDTIDVTTLDGASATYCMHSCIAPNMNRCIKCGMVWSDASKMWVSPEKAGAEMVGVRARLHEIAYRDTAVSVTVRADDLRAMLAAHVTDMELIAEMAERIMKNTKGSFFSAGAGLIHSFAYEIAEAVKRMQA